MSKSVTIVGAGLTGAVIARKLAEANYKVTVVEKRDHIAGNIYDYIDEETGCLVHKYGPHIFHTSIEEVWEFATKYTEFTPFELKNLVYFKDLDKWLTISFGLHTAKELLTEDEYNLLVEEISIAYPEQTKVPVPELLNSEYPMLKKFGTLLWENDYKLYTSKQWGINPEDVDPNILKRVPVYLTHYERYFTDTYEGIPKDGYTKWVENILNHENIQVKLNEDFEITLKDNKTFINDNEEAELVIYTGPVDKLLNYKHGDLRYRSLTFKLKKEKLETKPVFGDAPVYVYPDHSYPYTRITHYAKLPTQDHLEYQILGEEYSHAYDKSNPELEPYYPLSQAEDKEKYAKYAEELSNYSNLIVAGRLGDYKYYDMDKCIYRALEISHDILYK